jgi:membrane dipeptidase
MIFDAHLDLGMNALEWNRDYRRSISEIRAREGSLNDKPDRGNGTVCFPEMRRGGVRICCATLIARYVKPANPRPGWNSPEQAWAQTQGQLAWYRAMEEAGELVPITNTAQLDAHLARVNSGDAHYKAIGYVLSLEGADSILTPAHLERAYAQGLRALGPAHYGPGTYAQGTEAEGGLGPRGAELLAEMDRLGIILDITHLNDECFAQALDAFHGRVWASHSNCRALVPHQRQLSDEQIKMLIERGAVIGAAFDAWMLVPGWQKRKSRPAEAGVSLDHVADQIDHVCQIAGNAKHAGIGSDLDGAFGREQGPVDVDTIADLRKLEAILARRGYDGEAVRGIMCENFVRFLRSAWGRGQ